MASPAIMAARMPRATTSRSGARRRKRNTARRMEAGAPFDGSIFGGRTQYSTSGEQWLSKWSEVSSACFQGKPQRGGAARDERLGGVLARAERGRDVAQLEPFEVAQEHG